MTTINGVQFTLYNYQRTTSGVRMNLENTTLARLEEVIGDSADVAISNEFRGFGMKAISMYKKYGNPIRFEVEFVDSNLESAIQDNVDELEIQANAIAELAVLISGGDEEEPEEDEHVH